MVLYFGGDESFDQGFRVDKSRMQFQGTTSSHFYPVHCLVNRIVMFSCADSRNVGCVFFVFQSLTKENNTFK
jgi:hypothetical protein